MPVFFYSTRIEFFTNRTEPDRTELEPNRTEPDRNELEPNRQKVRFGSTNQVFVLKKTGTVTIDHSSHRCSHPVKLLAKMLLS
jgi:hypothetical protein